MVTLDALFERFLRERQYLKNVTPKTLVWYESAWKAFHRSRIDAASTGLISRSDLQRFVVHLRQRGVKPVTCNTWLRALNAFCRWLHEEGEAPTLIKLAPQRLEKKIIHTHRDAALRALTCRAIFGPAEA